MPGGRGGTAGQLAGTMGGGRSCPASIKRIIGKKVPSPCGFFLQCAHCVLRQACVCENCNFSLAGGGDPASDTNLPGCWGRAGKGGTKGGELCPVVKQRRSAEMVPCFHAETRKKQHGSESQVWGIERNNARWGRRSSERYLYATDSWEEDNCRSNRRDVGRRITSRETDNDNIG